MPTELCTRIFLHLVPNHDVNTFSLRPGPAARARPMSQSLARVGPARSGLMAAIP
jgi:hypothetical protein